MRSCPGRPGPGRGLAAVPGVARIVGNPVLKGLPSEPATFGACFSPAPPRIRSGPRPRTLASPLDRGRGMAGPLTRRPGALSSRGTIRGPGLRPAALLRGVGRDDRVRRRDGERRRCLDDQGSAGGGIVVASMDTGVDWTHPAIQSKYRGWNGGNPDHSYSWHDPVQHTTIPLDD